MKSFHESTSTALVFMLAFSLLKLGSGQWQVTGPDNSIKAFVGEDVVFSCSLSPKTNAEAMEVRFFRNRFSAIVHLYKAGKDEESVQMPEYQKRTELLKDGIVDGIVSLKLKKVTFPDAGRYGCWFDSKTHQEEATWQLEVSGQWQVTGPHNSIKAFVGEDVVFSCSLSPKTNAEAMEVRFFRNRFSAIVHLYKAGKDEESVQMPEYQKRTELLKDGIVDGIVSLKLKKVTPSDAGIYGCSFDSKTHQEEATWQLEVSEMPSQNNSWYAALVVPAVVLLVLGIIVGYCLWKRNFFSKCCMNRMQVHLVSLSMSLLKVITFKNTKVSHGSQGEVVLGL
ncbi:butyrophilin-like protein 8 [Ochotona princeps]|uniref:butyrophilin-like protein 8 n=1 Tax=Ochotona princeps TaxID=9978 RepID=UPI0027153AEF|nr:butyrophilin-like protein 8 [Ochotona princeps]